jgi:hypothetical protein
MVYVMTIMGLFIFIANKTTHKVVMLFIKTQAIFCESRGDQIWTCAVELMGQTKL